MNTTTSNKRLIAYVDSGQSSSGEMNAVDATDRAATHQEVEAPSLLTIILDTNPHAWALLADTLPLSKAVANLLVFINAHLSINYANRVAVLASHSERAEWLYPTPAPHLPNNNGDNSTVQPPDDANKYRPFAQLEYALLTNLQTLLRTTTPASISSSPSTLLAGALTRALTYISKQSLSTGPSQTGNTSFNYSDPSSVAGGNSLNPSDNVVTSRSSQRLTTRILILSVSGDLSGSYIELMNTIFACQRLSIPLDILKLSGSATFLQQAADTTGGIYLSLTTPVQRAGLLQYLMFAFLPDPAARENLVMPGETEGVDFRAACFCHKRVVDVGFVCSICLSIFCEPLGDGTCLLCGSHLSMGNYGRKPVVVARVKKAKTGTGKKRKVGDGVETPGSGGGGTPVPPG
ncbi:RNA polymerase II transcription factor B subunit 4 [Elasticomyces elasticus]|nr:RNA polymerase II transcription factor B subunit 4 [Elasticomyces elasticus]KAK3629747.1 RNA polymerase II transcription factor B subunit 4 [Elasticomyces elasticus]KAK4906493.1 RNA polymerase II transcription factor B subunit 4 [Elasticomyces elasticus]KAK5747291.1 RNA polymerase II transcription factor B subunit 4 [Elasticomyces elasticus]